MTGAGLAARISLRPSLSAGFAVFHAPHCTVWSSCAMRHHAPCATLLMRRNRLTVPSYPYQMLRVSRLQRTCFAAQARSAWVWLFAIALLASLAMASPMWAQPASPRAAARATTDGVFTAAQATRGGDVYAGLCQSCHSAESHTGAPFRTNWVGKPLGALYAYISSEMPKTEPGSLTEDEYTLVLAYILRMNGMPAGRKALTSDSAALDAILISLPGPGVKQ